MEFSGSQVEAAGESPGDQGKYLEVNDKIFANQRKISDDDLPSVACR